VSIGLNAGEIDEPDQEFYGRYACGAQLNLTGYCNRELEQRFDRQSMEPDQEKRKQLVWEIDKKLQEDGARPIIAHYRQATCRTSGKRADDDGQQHLQRLAHGRRLAG
jgi:peptide/nickel transport system substrate-binding protein